VAGGAKPSVLVFFFVQLCVSGPPEFCYLSRVGRRKTFDRVEFPSRLFQLRKLTLLGSCTYSVKFRFFSFVIFPSIRSDVYLVWDKAVCFTLESVGFFILCHVLLGRSCPPLFLSCSHGARDEVDRPSFYCGFMLLLYAYPVPFAGCPLSEPFPKFCKLTEPPLIALVNRMTKC